MLYRPEYPDLDFSTWFFEQMHSAAGAVCVLTTDNKDAADALAEEIAEKFSDLDDRVQGNRGDQAQLTWGDLRRIAAGYLRHLADLLEDYDREGQ